LSRYSAKKPMIARLCLVLRRPLKGWGPENAEGLKQELAGRARGGGLALPLFDRCGCDGGGGGCLCWICWFVCGGECFLLRVVVGGGGLFFVLLLDAWGRVNLKDGNVKRLGDRFAGLTE